MGFRLLLALSFATAVALSLLAKRSSRAVVLRGRQAPLNAAAVVAWSVALGAGLWRVLGSPASLWSGRVLLLVVILVIALPLLRDLFGALVLATSRAGVRPGDDVRIDGCDGRVVDLGLRTVTLRRSDGTLSMIPNRLFVEHRFERLSLASQEAPVEFEMALPRDADLDSVNQQVLEAATLSPYAAPNKLPEVWLSLAPTGEHRLRIRGYVFDRAYEDHYRGDVLGRAREVLLREASKPAGDPTYATLD